jgi:hypothetical protein
LFQDVENDIIENSKKILHKICLFKNLLILPLKSNCNVMKKQKFAFSIIELSIVVLVVGILIIGISKGSRVVSESKLKSAQNLTQGSPVFTIDGLLFWFEATLDISFKNNQAIDTDLGDVGTIATWININPFSDGKNNAEQINNDSKPRYVSNAINGLPAVNFDGEDEGTGGGTGGDHLTFNGEGLVNTDYTIFFVDQARSGGRNPILGGSGTTKNSSLAVGSSDVDAHNYYYVNQQKGFSGAITPKYTSPIPRINTIRSTIKTINSPLAFHGKTYSLNGVPQSISVINGTGSNASNILSNVLSYEGSAIGRSSATANYIEYFNGDIGEIIAFSRYLTEYEKENVEQYLKNKWGIK